MTCSECKYWDRPFDPKGSRSWYDLFGRCGRILHPYAIRQAHGKEAIATEPAYVTDASDYDATLWTKPDFGCTAFEAKT